MLTALRSGARHDPGAAARLPSAGRIRLFVIAAALLLLQAAAGAQQEPAKEPTPQANPLVLSSPAAVLVYFIRPDKTTDFEASVQLARDELSRDADPMRAQQRASWKFFKASETGPGGAAVYVAIIDPVVKGAEYSLGAIISAGGRAGTSTSLSTYLGVFANPALNILTLKPVGDQP